MTRPPWESNRIRDQVDGATWDRMKELTRGKPMNQTALQGLIEKQIRFLTVRGTLEDVQEKEGLIGAVISTSGLDEHSTAHRPYSMKKSLPGFRKTGTVLWRHGMDMMRGDLPVGHPVGPFPRYRKEGHELETRTQFDIEADAFAALVFHKYAVGDLSQWSAGFLPRVISEDRMHKGQMGPTFVEAVLREYSALPLGSNPDTTTETVRQLVRCLAGVTGQPGAPLADPEDFIQQQTMDSLVTNLGLPAGFAADLAEITLATILVGALGLEDKAARAVIQSVPSASMEEKGRILACLEDRTAPSGEGAPPAEGSARAAVPPHEVPQAPEDADWQLTDRQLQALPDDAFAWLSPQYLAGAQEAKVAGRVLPHHDPEGNVVWRAVAAAMSELRAPGAAGVPKKDRVKVHSHLAGHFNQFGRQVPSLTRDLEEQLEIGGATAREITDTVTEVNRHRETQKQRRNATDELARILGKLVKA